MLPHCVSAYRDVGKEREHAYMDVGEEREQDAAALPRERKLGERIVKSCFPAGLKHQDKTTRENPLPFPELPY